MIKYRVNLMDKKSITLTILGRDRIFTNNDEVDENIYTKTYPSYFVRIGQTDGFLRALAVPVFIPDPIEDFISKESTRSEESEKIYIPSKVEIKVVDEISQLLEDYIDDNKYDVKIETEEEK